MTKIFTMVKGEVDIVSDWVLYHGTIFGFANLYIIDNLSQDGTWEELKSLKNKYNINICRLPDYTKKGDYMTMLMKSFCVKGELAFPIDIDEFIVCYDKQTNLIKCDKNSFGRIFKLLPISAVYKMNYINCNIIVPDGYQRAAMEATNGSYVDYGSQAKSFFNTLLFNGKIDHGNHYNTQKYILTDLCLVHYHSRNLQQMKKKIYNNITGLGYNPFDLNGLKKIFTPSTIGYHHVKHQIDILEHKYTLGQSNISNSDINLAPISKLLRGLEPGSGLTLIIEELAPEVMEVPVEVPVVVEVIEEVVSVVEVVEEVPVMKEVVSVVEVPVEVPVIEVPVVEEVPVETQM